MVPTIWLVTHATEFDKPTNTGQLVAALGNASGDENSIDIKVVSWSRVNQNQDLLAAIQEPCLLVYPSAQAVEFDASSSELSLRHFKHFIIIDATWQLARKIYNQSPYLHALPAMKLVGAAPSRYILRRNQLQLGWCTAEIVVILLEMMQLPSLAEELTANFERFNQRY